MLVKEGEALTQMFDFLAHQTLPIKPQDTIVTVFYGSVSVLRTNNSPFESSVSRRGRQTTYEDKQIKMLGALKMKQMNRVLVNTKDKLPAAHSHG